MPFLGFDHIDTRVRSIQSVEPFYDRLLPALGLTEKRHAFVDDGGDWHDADFYRRGQTHAAQFSRTHRNGSARLLRTLHASERYSHNLDISGRHRRSTEVYRVLFR